jgi:hypothetical protein
LAVTAIFFYRVSYRHSAKALLSARRKTFGKAYFAAKFYVILALPNVALGKRFAECILLFAECPGH